jgi:hypothetical protein
VCSSGGAPTFQENLQHPSYSDDGDSMFLQNVVDFYQNTRHHISEDTISVIITVRSSMKSHKFPLCVLIV